MLQSCKLNRTSPQMTFSNFVLAVKNFIGLDISCESLLADNSHAMPCLISTENQERNLFWDVVVIGALGVNSLHAG